PQLITDLLGIVVHHLDRIDFILAAVHYVRDLTSFFNSRTSSS
ncbi:hypothetical protein LCGC14_3089070, partial [marine sediment metagenome]